MNRAPMWTPYTPQERQILLKHYSSEGPKGCLAMMPGRTYQGIVTFANSLGLKVTPGMRRKPQSIWSAEEDAIVREHYPLGGSIACIPLLPNKHRGQIHSRGNILGLRAPREHTEAQKAAFAIVREERAKRRKMSVEHLNEYESAPIVQLWRPVNTWKAEPIPAPRWVFELEAA